jgi:hypothetical protein
MWMKYKAIRDGDDGTPKFAKKPKRGEPEPMKPPRPPRYQKGQEVIVGDAVQSTVVLLVNKDRTQFQVFGRQFVEDFEVTGLLETKDDLIKWFSG